jgi:hypothetical protein
MLEPWCTVTVTDVHGSRPKRRYFTSSTYDAAHLYVTHAETHPPFPIHFPGKTTIFEIMATLSGVYGKRSCVAGMD